MALWNVKVLESEGNYGGGIFVGVAPFATITVNLDGSTALHHHYGLDLLMITEAMNEDRAYDHTGYFVCAVMGSSKRNLICSERCKSLHFKGIPHEKPRSSSVLKKTPLNPQFKQ